MSSTYLFLTGMALTLAAELGIVTYLKKPLHRILEELCGTSERAAFWVSFSNVTIMLVPVLFAMQYVPEVKAGTTPVLEIAAQLRWASAGLLSDVLVLGWVLSSFIRRQSYPLVATKQTQGAV